MHIQYLNVLPNIHTPPPPQGPEGPGVPNSDVIGEKNKIREVLGMFWVVIWEVISDGLLNLWCDNCVMKTLRSWVYIWNNIIQSISVYHNTLPNICWFYRWLCIGWKYLFPEVLVYAYLWPILNVMVWIGIISAFYGRSLTAIFLFPPTICKWEFTYQCLIYI